MPWVSGVPEDKLGGYLLKKGSLTFAWIERKTPALQLNQGFLRGLRSNWYKEEEDQIARSLA